MFSFDCLYLSGKCPLVTHKTRNHTVCKWQLCLTNYPLATMIIFQCRIQLKGGLRIGTGSQICQQKLCVFLLWKLSYEHICWWLSSRVCQETKKSLLILPKCIFSCLYYILKHKKLSKIWFSKLWSRKKRHQKYKGNFQKYKGNRTIFNF